VFLSRGDENLGIAGANRADEVVGLRALRNVVDRGPRRADVDRELDAQLPRTSTCPRSAAAETGSSHPRWHTSRSRRSLTQKKPSGRRPLLRSPARRAARTSVDQRRLRDRGDPGAGHGDVRQTWNRYGHLVPGGEEQARERLDAYLNPPKPTPTVAHTVAHGPNNDETPENPGVLQYRYRDSKPASEQ